MRSIHPSARRVVVRAAALSMLAVTLPLMGALPVHAARIRTISIGDASIVEGNAGQQTLTFRVTWTGSKGGAAPSVHYATSDVTATAGSDYTAASGTANLTNGGCRCATINVPIKGDTTTEGTETFQIDLSSASNGTIGDAQAIGTIYDNEGPPALVVGDVSTNEIAGTLDFTVQLTNASASVVAVDYLTVDGTAVAGADYTAASGTLTFTPGQTVKPVSVVVSDDTLAEDDETVLLDLTNASNASIVDAQGVGSIVNDDVDPTATIADVSVAEGDAGTSIATFTVSLDTASGRETAVDYATSDTSAVADVDYSPSSGTLTIPAGDTSATFDVGVIGETLHEGDETFGVTLSGEVNLTLGTSTAVGTITDDDPIPTLATDPVSVGESQTSVTVTLSLSNPTTAEVSADWSTSDGTATAGSDYAASSGTVVIAAGDTSTTVEIPLIGDTVDEPDETLAVVLSNVANASVGTSGTITLTDDDRSTTALTAKVVKRKTAVKVKGLLEPATSGLRVKVTLFKKKGTAYVQVATKGVAVKGLKDRDGDGKADGQYLASFPRPSKGRYRCKVTFPGSVELKRSTKTVAFRL